MEHSYTVWDVDSTLTGESLDELARTKLTEDQYQDFANVTKLGMNGEIPFSESLRRRVDVLVEAGVTIAEVEEFAQTLEITEEVRDHIQSLVQEHPERHIVLTGGFRRILLPLLLKIGFKEENIFTNTFADNGEVITGYDDENALAQDNGKVLQMLEIMTMEKYQHLDAKPKMTSIVGDGGSDMNILLHSLAITFVHYTGVAGKENRERIAKKVEQHEDMFASDHHKETVRILRERQGVKVAT